MLNFSAKEVRKDSRSYRKLPDLETLRKAHHDIKELRSDGNNVH